MTIAHDSQRCIAELGVSSADTKHEKLMRASSINRSLSRCEGHPRTRSGRADLHKPVRASMAAEETTDAGTRS